MAKGEAGAEEAGGEADEFIIKNQTF